MIKVAPLLVMPGLGPYPAFLGRHAAGLGCVDFLGAAWPCRHSGCHGALLEVKWL